MASIKKLTSCDVCRSRKVRCLKQSELDDVCIMCRKRGERCHFSAMRTRKSGIARAVTQHEPTHGETIGTNNETCTPQSSTRQGSTPPEISEVGIQSPPSSVGRTIAAHSVADERPSPPEATPPEVSLGRNVDSHTTQAIPAPSSTSSSSSRLFIDELLSQPQHQPSPVRTNDKGLFTADNQYVGSSALAFYSERTMSALSERLGHNRVSELIASMESTTAMHMNLLTDCDPLRLCGVSQDRVDSTPHIESNLIYIESYFDEVHPVYPFLDKEWFLQMVDSRYLELNLVSNKPFAALFYTLLALGCLHCDGGSFQPGKGLAWDLFSQAIALYADVILSKRTLLSMQALCAMTIFSITSEGFRYEGLFMREAARAASALSKKQFDDPRSEYSRQATFWVIYYLEKEYSFHTSMASVICDEDVSCPLPCPSPVIMQGLDWLRTAAIFSRILSKAYLSVFSISATMKSTGERLRDIDSLRAQADSWLWSLPDKFRPSHEFRSFRFSKPGILMIALRIHFMYYGLVVSLARLELHLCSSSPYVRRSEAKASLLLATRAIVALMQYIPHEPYSPMIVLTHMPVTAVFILFDFVVHNPLHQETKKNLAFLDITAGYFSRLDLIYSSKGNHFGTPFYEFATMAHDYVRNKNHQHQNIQLCDVGNGSATSEAGDVSPALPPEGDQLSTTQISRHGNHLSPINLPQQLFNPGVGGSETDERDWVQSNTFFDIQDIQQLTFPLDEESLCLGNLNWRLEASDVLGQVEGCEWNLKSPDPNSTCTNNLENL